MSSETSISGRSILVLVEGLMIVLVEGLIISLMLLVTVILCLIWAYWVFGSMRLPLQELQ